MTFDVPPQKVLAVLSDCCGHLDCFSPHSGASTLSSSRSSRSISPRCGGHLPYLSEEVPFDLHPNLVKKIFIADFPLCRVLLEDEKHYTWLFLVPRRRDVSRVMDLSESDQLQLIKELDFIQRAIWEEFQPTQLNVAAIGNKTPQLHIHVIGRNVSDPAWPNTVWDHPIRSPYDERSKHAVTQRLKYILSTYSCKRVKELVHASL